MASKGTNINILRKVNNVYTAFAGGKTCEYDIKREMKEVSSPTSSDAREYIPGRYGWTMKTQCLVYGTNPREAVMTAFLQRTLLDVAWNDDTTREMLTGKAYITSVSESDTIHQVATFSITLQGTGAITYTPDQA